MRLGIKDKHKYFFSLELAPKSSAQGSGNATRLLYNGDVKQDNTDLCLRCGIEAADALLSRASSTTFVGT